MSITINKLTTHARIKILQAELPVFLSNNHSLIYNDNVVKYIHEYFDELNCDIVLYNDNTTLDVDDILEYKNDKYNIDVKWFPHSKNYKNNNKIINVKINKAIPDVLFENVNVIYSEQNLVDNIIVHSNISGELKSHIDIDNKNYDVSTIDHNIDVGNYNATVTFIPTNNNYEKITSSIVINIEKSTPNIIWNPLIDLISSNAIDKTYQSVIRDIDGVCKFDFNVGDYFDIGKKTLRCTFYPTDIVNYNKVSITNELFIVNATRHEQSKLVINTAKTKYRIMYTGDDVMPELIKFSVSGGSGIGKLKWFCTLYDDNNDIVNHEELHVNEIQITISGRLELYATKEEDDEYFFAGSDIVHIVLEKYVTPVLIKNNRTYIKPEKSQQIQINPPMSYLMANNTQQEITISDNSDIITKLSTPKMKDGVSLVVSVNTTDADVTFLSLQMFNENNENVVNSNNNSTLHTIYKTTKQIKQLVKTNNVGRNYFIIDGGEIIRNDYVSLKYDNGEYTYTIKKYCVYSISYSVEDDILDPPTIDIIQVYTQNGLQDITLLKKGDTVYFHDSYKKIIKVHKQILNVFQEHADNSTLKKLWTNNGLALFLRAYIFVNVEHYD
jgi:hypothetical protein